MTLSTLNSYFGFSSNKFTLCSVEYIYIYIPHCIYVTAAGFGVLLPGTTLGRTVFVTGTGRAGRNDDSVRDGIRILIY